MTMTEAELKEFLREFMTSSEATMVIEVAQHAAEESMNRAVDVTRALPKHLQGKALVIALKIIQLNIEDTIKAFKRTRI